MGLNIFYNFLSLIIIFGIILTVSFYIRNFCYCFKKRFLGSTLLLVGFFLSTSVPFYLSNYLISPKNKEINEKIGGVGYNIFIHPKSYPFEDQVKISFKDYKNNKYFSIIVKDENFNITNILNQIEPKLSSLKDILK